MAPESWLAPLIAADASTVITMDYEHGRVFRLQPKGLKTKKAEDLGTLPVKELVLLLVDRNPWRARTALRPPSRHG